MEPKLLDELSDAGSIENFCELVKNGGVGLRGMIPTYSAFSMGFFSPTYTYDPALLAKNDPNGARWLRDGDTVIFGPEYAAAVLDQEQAFLKSGISELEASRAEWIAGLSGKELRTTFPEAVAHAQKFRKQLVEGERGRNR